MIVIDGRNGRVTAHRLIQVLKATCLPIDWDLDRGNKGGLGGGRWSRSGGCRIDSNALTKGGVGGGGEEGVCDKDIFQK